MAAPEKLDKPQKWTHPDTGEKVEIPAGAVVHRVGDTVQTMIGPVLLESETEPEGTVLYWQNPPETPEGELHPAQDPEREPSFDRSGLARRVLQHVTDEKHVGRGPRNTPERLYEELVEDPATFTGKDFSVAAVEKQLRRLRSAGLVERRDDGTYGVTDEGDVELRT